MTRDEILQIFRSHQAIVENTHVVYTSGRHGHTYINKDAIYPDTAAVSQLCLAMAQRALGLQVETVIGPTVGAVILSQWTAHHLSNIGNQVVHSVYAEKTENGFAIRRGYDAWIRKNRVLIVEDVITTGGSVKRVIDSVKKCEGTVVGVVALCNRGDISTSTIGAPALHCLLDIKLESYAPQKCPLCAQGIPINISIGKSIP